MLIKFTYEGQIIGFNQRYKHRCSKQLSDEYKAFREYLGWECKKQNPQGKPLAGKLEITIFFNSGHDADNISKAIFDGLQGIAFGNDRQIDDFRVKRVKDIQPGFVLFCREIEPNN